LSLPLALPDLALPGIGPAPVLAVIVGVFHTALYVLIRGSAGGRLIPLLIAATLGAYAGQALGGRLGDPVRIGDFGMLYSSLVAWLGLLVVTVVGVLVPARGRA
jgi:hypothetical protein